MLTTKKNAPVMGAFFNRLDIKLLGEILVDEFHQSVIFRCAIIPDATHAVITHQYDFFIDQCLVGECDLIFVRFHMPIIDDNLTREIDRVIKRHEI